MKLEPMLLILDLDGVLITTPPWQPDVIDTDGYSNFNEVCTTSLNKILTEYSFEIWLSSSRRIGTSIEEFNRIFKREKSVNR